MYDLGKRMVQQCWQLHFLEDGCGALGGEPGHDDLWGQWGGAGACVAGTWQVPQKKWRELHCASKGEQRERYRRSPHVGMCGTKDVVGFP